MKSVLNTKEASERLSVSIRRVQALINSGRLPATKVGRDFIILESDLPLVTERKAGRPAKAKAETNGADSGASNGQTANAQPFQTIFDICPEVIGSVSGGISDLSTNKKYLEDFGAKSAGRLEGRKPRD